MAYNLIIKEKVIADVLTAYTYYESKSPGLGEKFIAALHDRYRQIAINPQHYSYIDYRKKIRDVKLNGFPYVVIYDIEEENVIIYAVHNSYKKSEVY